MVKRIYKLAVCTALSAIMLISAGVQVKAASLSEVLPAAGIGLTLSDGTSLANIHKVDNEQAAKKKTKGLTLSQMNAKLAKAKSPLARTSSASAGMMKDNIFLQIPEEVEEETAEVSRVQKENIKVEKSVINKIIAEVASVSDTGYTMLKKVETENASTEKTEKQADKADSAKTLLQNIEESATGAVSAKAPAALNNLVSAKQETQETQATPTLGASVIKEEVITEETDVKVPDEKPEDEESEEKVVEETETFEEVSAKQDSQLTIEEREFKSLVIAKVDNYVNVRSTPDEHGEIVGKLYDKSVGDFIAEEKGWYEITSGNVTGFVKAEYCVTGKDAIDLAKEVGTRIAEVNTVTLRVREEASENAPILGLIPEGDELLVIDEAEDGDWLKVDIEEGTGWISSEFVTLRTDFVKAESREEEKARLAKEAEERRAAQEALEANNKKKNTNNDTKKEAQTYAPIGSGSEAGKAVVNYALQFVGNPYVYGGSSLTNGTDCSGFVMSVYKNFGVNLPHSSSADRSVGAAVGGLSEAQPGDIVCYSGHVGIYVGGGQIVHASTRKTGIIVSSATYRNILSVRRIF